MAKRIVDAHFTGERSYFENQLGREFDFTAATGPYEYLLGALSGCFAITLISYLGKDNGFSSIDIHSEGAKRTGEPATLKTTDIRIVAKGVKDRKDFEDAVTKAENNCSIYQTVKMVSSMNVDLIFED